MRLYCIEIDNHRANPEYGLFHANMSQLKAVPLGYAASMSGALVSHTQDPITVHVLATSGMKNRNDVKVTEVTKSSMNTIHIGYKSLVSKYFLPHNKYPAIK